MAKGIAALIDLSPGVVWVVNPMTHLLLALEDIYGDDRNAVAQGIVVLIKHSPGVAVDAVPHLLKALNIRKR